VVVAVYDITERASDPSLLPTLDTDPPIQNSFNKAKKWVDGSI